MIVIPNRMKALDKLTSSTARFSAMAGVRVKSLGGRKWRLEATDTKCLIRVDGENTEADGYCPNMDASLTKWKTLFTGKPTKKDEKAGSVALTPSSDQAEKTAFLSYSIGGETTQGVRENASGQFPNTDGVLLGHETQASACVEPSMLAKLAGVLAECGGSDKDGEISFRLSITKHGNLLFESTRGDTKITAMLSCPK